ncbi:MAG: hypothetical protein ABIP51_06575 [Bacteroidia bacterium]
MKRNLIFGILIASSVIKAQTAQNTIKYLHFFNNNTVAQIEKISVINPNKILMA